MIVQDVFTPTAYPEHTYVERDHGSYEKNLEFKLRGPSSIISLSGPSKSGKSMLINNVADRINHKLIKIYGSGIHSPEDIWESALDQIGAPDNTEITKSTEKEIKKEGKAGGKIPFASMSAGANKRDLETTQETILDSRRGIKQVAEVINVDETILYIDDAHYIDKEAHEEISESIKEAYERGLTICLSYISHRSDDLTRQNPDLSGRVESYSLDFWEEDDLQQIGKEGFEILNFTPSDLVLKNLARESVGSPHLMQKLCLGLCKELEIYNKSGGMEPLNAKIPDIETVLRKIATNDKEDYSTVLELLNGAASSGRNSKKKFNFGLGDEGDIYEAILRSFAKSPPKLSTNLSEIIDRINRVCEDSGPGHKNIENTIMRMDELISDRVPNNEYCYDWDEDLNRLEIPEPNLLFCIRWSDITSAEPKLH